MRTIQLFSLLICKPILYLQNAHRDSSDASRKGSFVAQAPLIRSIIGVMKTIALSIIAVALVIGCGGGGGGIAPTTNTLVGGTWHWTAYETNGGTRTYCTAVPQPSPCGTTWSFQGTQTAGTFNGGPNAWTLIGGILTFPTGETTAQRWIGENEFAERRIGNADWEIWTRY